jgi:hypothetical protein
MEIILSTRTGQLGGGHRQRDRRLGWRLGQAIGQLGGLASTTWTSNDKNTSANISGTYGGTSEHSKSWACTA